jgi:hypothetical protein
MVREIKPRVAVCLNGAFRDFSAVWPSIWNNLVAPSAADVYVVTARHPFVPAFGSKSHYLSELVSLRDLHPRMNSSLRGGAIWDSSARTAANVAKWAGVDAAKSVTYYLFEYHLKRWACNRIVAEAPDGPYDLVVSMRPDIYILRLWNLTMTMDEARSKLFQLTVGQSERITFGVDEVLLNDFTVTCISDWIMVSSMQAFTAHSQLVHHLGSADRFIPCPGRGQPWLAEYLFGNFLWRVGMPRRMRRLYVELSRKTSFNPAKMQYGLARRSFDGQEYCKLPAFKDFADQYVLVDDAEVRGYTHGSISHPGMSSPLPIIHSNVTLSMFNCSAKSIYPACKDTVDVTRSMTPCARVSHRQYVTITAGRGKPFPAICASSCASLPGVVYLRPDGTWMPAKVFASSGNRSRDR